MASTTSPILNVNGRDLGSAYLVDQPAFQGPIDLLLHLIERQEMAITEIAIVNVTDAYLQTIEHLEELEPGALADFLVVASRLLYIKSRALLPKPKTNEEDEEEEDPGDALLRQLIEYRQFKEVAKTLKDRDIAGLRVYVRNAPGPELEKRLDLSNVDMDALQRAVRRALDRIPVDMPLPKVHTYAVTISQQISNVRKHIIDVQRKIRINQVSGSKTKEPVIFTGLLGESTSRMEIIITFLAVLELIKQQEIEAVQDDVFSEIVLMPLDALIEEADAPPKEDTEDDVEQEQLSQAM